MKEKYIKAVYRIKRKIYNTGYIFIDKDGSMIGVFSLDNVSIKKMDDKLYFYLDEYNLDTKCYYETQTFISQQSFNRIEYPHTYFLYSEDDSSICLSLELIKKVEASQLSSDILQRFEDFFSK